MDPKDEFEFYADENNREPAGPPLPNKGNRLSSHVPVRFTPQTIAAVRTLAHREHISVSNWIRRAVSRELDRLAPPQSLGTPGITSTTPESSETFVENEPDVRIA